MKIHAIQCKKCKDIIYSRATHDFRRCTCQKCFIDGGFDYTRLGYEKDLYPKSLVLNLKVTKEELLDDYYLNKNKFGLIKGQAKKKV